MLFRFVGFRCAYVAFSWVLGICRAGYGFCGVVAWFCWVPFCPVGFIGVNTKGIPELVVLSDSNAQFPAAPVGMRFCWVLLSRFAWFISPVPSCALSSCGYGWLSLVVLSGSKAQSQ